MHQTARLERNFHLQIFNFCHFSQMEKAGMSPRLHRPSNEAGFMGRTPITKPGSFSKVQFYLNS